MCGIAGVLSRRGVSRDELRLDVSRMTRSIAHRGPDGGGIWIDASAGIAFGHRRLAILDLSDAGIQPMRSASGRFVLTFNGEIYNFRQIRAQLTYPFKTETDTEVLLAAIEAWGIERTLKSLDGMFAFAVWDRKTRSLTLARDRFGEKPLYYFDSGGVFAFASELRALEQVSSFSIDENARREFLLRGYMSGAQCIYEGVRKLPPAHWMSVGDEPRSYWQLSFPEKFRGSEAEAFDELDVRMRNAVRSRMIADVPVGVFLSGGVDSSMIAGFAGDVRTFTAAVRDRRYDESGYARDVAGHLGLRHETVEVTPADVPDIPGIYDEPFADSSQIPAVLVSRLARQSVKTVLCGDGGDELFGGYPRYEQIEFLARVPRILRSVSAGFAGMIPGEKADLLASALSARDLAALYAGVMGGELTGAPMSDPLGWMGAHDLRHYFVDDLLVKLDRAAMSCGLETRLPFLDPQLVEFAFSLPPSMRRGKKILSELLARAIPARLFERPKQGFMIPLADWLRGPLRDWAEDLVPGIVRELPYGQRCVRAWSRIVLASWLRRRVGAASSDLLPEPALFQD